MNRARVGSQCIVAVFAVAVLVAGCMEIGFLGSSDETFTGRERITLPASRSDILDVISDVGKGLGYSVSQLDKAAGTIGLSSSSSTITTILIGKMTFATLTIQLQDEGKALDVHVSTVGNFGTGGQDAAMRLIDDFKAKLLSRLGTTE